MSAKFFATTTPHRSAAAGLLFCLAAGFVWVAFIVFLPHHQFFLMALSLAAAVVASVAGFAVRGGRRASSRWERETATPQRKFVPAVMAIALCLGLFVVWWNLQ